MKRPAAGFTLVELIVVMAVSGIVMLAVASFLMDNIYQTALASERDSQAREVQQSLDLAANDIRISANADTNNRWPDANSPGGADQYGWASSSSTLVLATAVQDSSGRVIFADAKNYITEKNNIVYFVSNGTLYKRLIANPVSGNTWLTTCPAASSSTSCPADKELLHNVTAFSVAYLDEQNTTVPPSDARAIQLHVTVSKKVFKQTLTNDYTTRMVFRND
jgi:prepilin-type N-terminal cleavage/methylation domain-containing protein